MRAVAFFLFLLIFQPASAQFFRGRVVDKAGHPVPDATIYINELKSGITADNRGEFQTQLSSGTYNCEVSSLGYKREKFSFEMKNEDVSRTIALQEIVYELKEVHFTGRGEDRGNAIMRK
ncbi:MAG: carboxypeptidase-like regulatory domain-containing protein, partial [Bacteroidales bacterium]|nr:carboxypeptidase-like regulatory domain-containing protein [Bacteroidales bacterium]